MQTITLTADEARELILEYQTHISELDGLVVEGSLDFANESRLRVLPEGMSVRRLTLDGCTSLHDLPGLRCYDLSARATPLTRISGELQVENRLDLEGCIWLEDLPARMRVGTLNVRGCSELRRLPEHVENIFFLDAADCVQLSELPARGPEAMGRLNVRGCTQLRALPSWLKRVAQLDVSGCVNLVQWPEELRVISWVDLAAVPLEAVPQA
ncbi:MAG: hypothetical protein J2P36_37655, partial [Ktedonobacteraceae bacterium]|nr:hypothetical protein [Ktedonobacteraceae bacterium]